MKTLKEIRIALGLTKKEVCENAKLSIHRLDNIEVNEHKKTRASDIAELCLFYKNNHQIDINEINFGFNK